MNHHKGYERTFGLKNHANIMCLPYPCKLAQEMFFDELNTVRDFELDLLTSDQRI
jgi:hypothetical protein